MSDMPMHVMRMQKHKWWVCVIAGGIILSFMTACRNRDISQTLEHPAITLVSAESKRYLSEPVWFPDGDRLIVTSYPVCFEGCEPGIYALDIQHGEFSRLGTVGWKSSPAWTADPDIFSFYQGELQHGIYKSSISEWAPLFVAKGFEAAWSPDGRYVALSRPEEETTSTGYAGMSVYVRKLFTGREIKVFDTPNGEDPWITGLSWSPDSNWLALSATWFLAGVGDKSGLFIVHPDGTGLRQLTELAAYPGWMPDGEWLFYTGSGGLSFAPLDFSCVVSPLEFNDIASPAISPSGDKLAFEHDDNIYILNLDKVLGPNNEELYCPDQ